MRACIVGHGPSMYANKYGAAIDAHDTIIRLKQSEKLLQRPELFGSKTSIICGSFYLNTSLIKPHCSAYWLFIDTRTEDIKDDGILRVRALFAPNTCLVDRPLCMKWIAHYRKMREKMAFDARQQKKASTRDHRPLSDDLGHLHCSAGMFCITYALVHLKPDELNIYGFDNVASGTFNWSVTRGPDWQEYPDHNWLTESRMVYDVAKEYGYRLENKSGVLCASAM